MGFRKRGRKGPSRVIKKNPHRINNEIRGINTVRLVGDNVQDGVYSFNEALDKAKDLELDLVEISGHANPPVCKILDYGKFLYDQNKKKKESQKNQHNSKLKELRLGPNISDYDLERLINQAKGFLEEGHKVRASLMFKGRSIVHKDIGKTVLLKFATGLEDSGIPDGMPKMEGKKMFIQMSPRKK